MTVIEFIGVLNDLVAEGYADATLRTNGSDIDGVQAVIQTTFTGKKITCGDIICTVLVNRY